MPTLIYTAQCQVLSPGNNLQYDLIIVMPPPNLIPCPPPCSDWVTMIR